MNLSDQNILFERYVKGKEADLIDQYITDGPSELKAKLGFSDEEWQVIFDYLVFECNLLYKCVINGTEFFLEEYVKHGMTHVREILNVLDEKYNNALEVVFDYLVISKEGLYYHVIQHRNRYVEAMRQRGSDFVRKVLGVNKEKYNENWEKVLNILLQATVKDIFSERSLDEGLKAFSMIFNGVREHKRIFKSKIL